MQLRKETKYSGLVDEINATEVWKPMLFTLEVGARGLVGLSTHKTFVRLGFTSSQAKVLCKRLSLVVVRCSYAVYQAHNNLYWSHNTDLIVVEGTASSSSDQVTSVVDTDVEAPFQANEKKLSANTNIQVLHNNGVHSLFHFTDASNLESISKHGLLTWKKLEEQHISAKMNSSELSHRLDAKAGLADFVRLSFCKKHPMMYLALKDQRISRPVVLEIKLEVVSRPGVLFCAINAASSSAKASEDPSVIHFETVRASSQRRVVASEKVFFQGEVLVPGCIPPHLIRIPKVDAMAKPLEFRGRLLDSSLVGCTLSGKIGVKDSKTSSLLLHQNVALEQGSSAPEPLVSLLDVHSAGVEKGNHETFVAPKMLGTLKVGKEQEERKLADLVDPDFVPVCQQVACELDATTEVSLAAPALVPLDLMAQTAVAVASAHTSTGGVLAVLADGDCCYHLCGVFGDLMMDRDAVQSGTTACLPSKTKAARVRIMDNINEYIDFVKSTCVDGSEVEGAILENFGELPSSFVPRVTGVAKGEDRLGLINDFAAYTAKTPFQVMVIDSSIIWSDSSDEELRRAVRKAELKTDTEYVKCRVLCAVLHKKHYDLGVVRSAGSVQAVFKAGSEWEVAASLILAFIKSKAPLRGQLRSELCPRWVPPGAAAAPASTRSSAFVGIRGAASERMSVRKRDSKTAGRACE